MIIYQIACWEGILKRYLIDYHLKSSTREGILKINISGRKYRDERVQRKSLTKEMNSDI